MTCWFWQHQWTRIDNGFLGARRCETCGRQQVRVLSTSGSGVFWQTVADLAPFMFTGR